ncbi:tyrosine-type recombinase/integrase [Desulfitobacterium sp. PCE1]|uniref:tyrosine-type recombinase/integrase n=1 Tax=Desulfitobacterium sp. PCE1 TaxID=146907 RepID=UPI00036370C4|nr:tyrosine-type recombinase/integrase [Desulfitobacterium sp. PCE1]
MRLSNFDFKIEEFILYCTSRNLSKRTIQSYESSLKLFGQYLSKEFKIDDIQNVTKSHIRHYVKHLQERGKYTCSEEGVNNNPLARTDRGKPISVNTINNYVRNIKVFFNWLKDEEDIEKNPMEKIRLLKGHERIKPKLTQEEISAILNSFDKTRFDGYRSYLITLFILDTGVRISECVEIKMDDLNLSNQACVLRYTKNKKERIVFFSSKLKRELKNWIKFKDRYMSNELLFPSRRGNLLLITGYERVLRRIGGKLEIDLYPHRLRATFAQYYLLNGGDLISLGRLLGHSSPEVTKIYLQLDEQSIAEQYRKFSPVDHLKLK